MQAVYDYQQTVLNAFTEVINRMSKVDNYGKSLEIKRQQLEALEASSTSQTKLFQNARAEYVEVLLAQRDLQDARMVIIETKKQHSQQSLIRTKLSAEASAPTTIPI